MNCSVGYEVVLAVAALCIMCTILLLQGFGAGGFYIGDTPLTILVVSMSVLVALGALGALRCEIALRGSG